MKDRTVGFVEVSAAGDTLQLPPGTTTGMPIGAEVAASEPAIVGTIRGRTEVRLGVDSPLAAAGEANEGRWEVRRLGACCGPLFTGFTKRFMDESRKGLGGWRALAAERGRPAGCLGYGPWSVGPPNVHHEADQHESNQEKLVKQQVRRHDEVLLHGDERRPLYRSHPLPNYPSSMGTGPGRLRRATLHGACLQPLAHAWGVSIVEPVAHAAHCCMVAGSAG